MNDFTKDELKCLHNAIVLQLRDIPMSETNAIRRSELVGKLQSMIDNYCEHEPEGDYHVCVDKCRKCGRIIEDDNQ
ncbi:TPA: hypothetical protein JAG59_002006 [Legionella pneumophila]|nr:hypothetical protein [Legionella pneumophila]HAT5918700.1 hypothetical protein [Legionella pneumophila]HAT5922945.1 hypothetical protein [Legionella pneumophila]HAT5934471.1 hypothetical protein [Legionella pneumophila]HAT5950223.1 hypothetical protein [Legionella pneumophila]